MQFVITGFDAFDKAAVNPSQLAIERLDTLLQQGLGPDDRWLTHTLATCCNEAWSALQARVAELAGRHSTGTTAVHDDFAVIMTGLAGNRNRICLERFALNVRSYRIDDNRGHRWQEEYIEPGAPDAMRCKLPLFELTAYLNENGLSSDISNYAGSFVCNETYFRAMHKWHADPRCRGILFVHFPNPIDYYGTNPQAVVPRTVEELRDMSEAAIAEYARSVVSIAKFIAMQAQVVARK